MRADPTPARPADERGITLIELLITMSLMGLVMSVAGAGLISMSRAAKTTTERSIANANLRLAMERVARDVRAANPIDDVTAQSPALATTTYPTRISFTVFCNPAISTNCPASGLRQVVYRVQTNALEVSYNNGTFQKLLNPDAASGPLASRQDAVINTATEPVFTYLKADGSALDPAVDLGTKFRDCTQAVRIRLRVITENGNTTTPADLSTTVTLRNFNEVSGC